MSNKDANVRLSSSCAIQSHILRNCDIVRYNYEKGQKCNN